MEAIRHDHLVISHYFQQDLGCMVSDNGIIPMMDDQLGHIEIGFRVFKGKRGFNVFSETNENRAIGCLSSTAQLIRQTKSHVVGEEYALLGDADICEKSICGQFPSEDVDPVLQRPKKVGVAYDAVWKDNDSIPCRTPFKEGRQIGIFSLDQVAPACDKNACAFYIVH